MSKELIGEGQLMLAVRKGAFMFVLVCCSFGFRAVGESQSRRHGLLWAFFKGLFGLVCWLRG